MITPFAKGVLTGGAGFVAASYFLHCKCGMGPWPCQRNDARHTANGLTGTESGMIAPPITWYALPRPIKFDNWQGGKITHRAYDFARQRNLVLVKGSLRSAIYANPRATPLKERPVADATAYRQVGVFPNHYAAMRWQPKRVLPHTASGLGCGCGAGAGLGGVSRISDKSDPSRSEIVKVVGYGGRVFELQRGAAAAYYAMLQAMRNSGIEAPAGELTSGYRSSAYQQQLFDRAVARYGSEAEARRWVAPPGGSAHQSGRAIDMKLAASLSNDSSNVARLRETPAYKWLAQHARKFGFAPYSREPWHWEINREMAQLAETGDSRFVAAGNEFSGRGGGGLLALALLGAAAVATAAAA